MVSTRLTNKMMLNQILLSMITMEFSWNAALIASNGSNAGVVITTTDRYTTMVIIPTMIAFWIGFIYSSP